MLTFGSVISQQWTGKLEDHHKKNLTDRTIVKVLDHRQIYCLTTKIRLK